MRVLWLTENYPPSRGGMAQSCDRIVAGLRATGMTVDLAHLTRSTTASWALVPQQGGRQLTAPLEDDPEHALHRLWTMVAAEHDRDSFTHVVAFGGAYPIHAAPIYAAWLDVPLVVLLRGNDFDAGVFSLRRRSSLLDALRAAACVCVVSRSAAARVHALVPEVAVEHIANGIELADWELLPSEVDKARAWREEHVPRGRRTIGLIGQLKRKKGALFFFDALSRTGLADRFHVILVGDLEPAIVAWLADRDRVPPVSCSQLPFLDRYELLGLLPACDVVALPSFYDGLPNVAIEAAALGIPLLTSDAGGLADLVDSTIGWSFRAGDEDACREAMIAVATTSDDELAAKGAAAAERVRRSFLVDTEIAGYVGVLDRTARGARP